MVFLHEFPSSLWGDEAESEAVEAPRQLSESAFGEHPRDGWAIAGFQQEWISPGLLPGGHAGDEVIVQFGDTFIILGLIHRRGKKKGIHIPFSGVAEDHIPRTVVVTYFELVR